MYAKYGFFTLVSEDLNDNFSFANWKKISNIIFIIKVDEDRNMFVKLKESNKSIKWFPNFHPNGPFQRVRIP